MGLKSTGRFSPLQIIRYLVLAIIVMGGLIFAKYIYLPKHKALEEYQKKIEKAESDKFDLTRKVSEAQAKFDSLKKQITQSEVIQTEMQASDEETQLDQLLTDLFIIGDAEQVTLLQVKPNKKEKTFTPIIFSVQGEYFNTIRFLEQAATLKGVGGISSVKIEDPRLEINKYVVTTTFVMPSWLIE